MLSVAMVLGSAAREWPGRAAVIDDDTVLTYAELDERSARVAALLAANGVRPGDHVAMTCPNTAWFPVVYYGILKAGAVVVPLSILLRANEIAAALADSAAVAYVRHPGTERLPLGAEAAKAFEATPGCAHLFTIGPDLAAAMAAVEPMPGYRPREATDAAAVLYTSGTTGRAKGVELSHTSLVLNTVALGRLYGVPDHDVHLVAAPLSHTLGMSVQMNAPLSIGATIVLMDRFDPRRAVRLMTEHRVTFIAGVPTMYRALEEECGGDPLAAALAHVRIALSGGAALPVALMRRYRERYGVQVLEGYGLSETGTSISVTPQDGPRAPAGTIGTPVWGMDLRLVGADGAEVPDGEVGEIALRGPCLMTRYLNRPEETAASLRDGWFHTGDLARRDADGFYHIVDRLKDVILRGGYTVYPSDVEEWFGTHPAVSDAVAVGVPDERYGEEVKLIVVRRDGAEVTEEELIAWGREGLARHKYPRIVEFREVIPRSPTGKILRRELR